MTKNDAIREMACMVTWLCKDKNEKGVGMWIGKYWLTPSTCYELASLIEQINDEDYGAGNWSLDKHAIDILRNHSYQNETDYSKTK